MASISSGRAERCMVSVFIGERNGGNDAEDGGDHGFRARRFGLVLLEIHEEGVVSAVGIEESEGPGACALAFLLAVRGT